MSLQGLGPNSLGEASRRQSRPARRGPCVRPSPSIAFPPSGQGKGEPVLQRSQLSRDRAGLPQICHPAAMGTAWVKENPFIPTEIPSIPMENPSIPVAPAAEPVPTGCGAPVQGVGARTGLSTKPQTRCRAPSTPQLPGKPQPSTARVLGGVEQHRRQQEEQAARPGAPQPRLESKPRAVPAPFPFSLRHGADL